MESFPQTLKAALAKDGNIWSNLWQLAVFLRCSVGGMDSTYLKKGEVIRQRARKLNWHQPLCQHLPCFLAYFKILCPLGPVLDGYGATMKV